MSKFNLKKTSIATGLALSSLLPFAAFADGTDPATAGAAALTGLSTGQSSYLPVMIGLAVTSVGIMIAVKWVKRGRGAA